MKAIEKTATSTTGRSWGKAHRPPTITFQKPTHRLIGLIPWVGLLFAGMAFFASRDAQAWTTMKIYGNPANDWNAANGISMDKSGNFWYKTIQKTDATGNWYFRFYANTTHYGPNPPSADAQVNLPSPYDCAEGSSKALYVSGTQNRYYSFSVKDLSSLRIAVQETASAPVSISAVSYDTTGANGKITVWITSSGTPSTGEKIFVRWSKDSWASSTFVEATGSGTSWKAELSHGDGDANATVSFYVLTTTFSSPTHADADLQTIKLSNNSGANWSYKVGPNARTNANTISTAYLGDTNLQIKVESWQTLSSVNRSYATVFMRYNNSNLTAGTTSGPGRDPGASTDEFYAETPQFTSTGDWYWSMRVSYGSGNDYWLMDAADWYRIYNVQPAGSRLKITVGALNPPSGALASKASSSQIDLSWTKGVSGVAKDTVIFRSTSATAPTPVGGTTYNPNTDYTIGGISYRCIYRTSGTTTSDTGLSAGTKYYYYFFAENYSYYSSGVSADACTAVSIGTQPANATACVGATAQFTVSAGVGASPTYKWQVDKGGGWADCTASDGANFTTPTFTTVATTSGMNGYKYRCQVTDDCGTAVNTDGNATLTVNTKSADPTSATAGSSTICSGESTTLTLNGGGGGTGETIKWYTGSCGGTLAATGNGASVSPGATTTYYGRYEDGSPCNYNSACASVEVTVIPASVGGTAAAVDSSVCSGESPTVNLTGGTGNVIKWQYSADNFVSDVHDIVNVTSNLNNAPAITATTYYRAVQQNSTCSAANSSVETVTIQSPTPAVFDWRSEADSGNWVWPNTGDYPWYSNPNYFTEPENDVRIAVNNNVYASSWYNDVSDLVINQLEYGSSATDARTLTGNALAFTDLCGTEPVITNASAATHVINVDLTGDDTEPLNIYATGGGLTFGGDLDNNGQDILVATLNGKAVSVSGEISGDGALAKYDNGSLTLSGANSYSGGTTITGAYSKVYIAGDGNLGDTAGDLLIHAGEEGGLWITGATTLNAGRTITIDEYGGTINGGANAVTINGPVVNNAVWAASTDRQFYLKADTGGTITLAGELTGDGDLVKKLPGTLVMNNVNENYTGDIYLDKGTIETAVADAFGDTGWINLGADAAGNNGATILNYTADGIDVDNTINIRGYTEFNDTKSILVDTACDVNFDGTVYLHDSLTLTADGTGTMTFNGALTKGAGEGSGGKQTTFLADNLTKNGDGTVYINNAANTYDGTTTINDGTWVVASGASSANSAHVVDATADGSTLLMGEGTIGALSLQNDGAVSPGDSTGVDAATLTVSGAADLGGTGGGTYVCDITGLAPEACDLIDASGAVTASSAMTLDLPDTAPAGFDENTAYYWIVAKGGDGTSAANMDFLDDMNANWEATGTFGIEMWPRSGDDWIVVTYSTPTRVVLYSFTLGVENGAVVVRWRTASEARTVGFRLERQDGNAWIQINDDFVYARGVDGLGAGYSLADPGAVPGGTYVYRLIEEETGGSRQIHGPFQRTASELGFAMDDSIALTANGVLLRWLSRPDEFYRILRSTNLLEGLEGFRPIATGIEATPPENEYLDGEAGSIGIYLIQIEEE